MKISKIDRHFLIRWVGIGLVVGIGIVLEGYLDVPVNLQGITSGLLALVFQYLLLTKYIKNAKLFVLFAAVLGLLNLVGGPLVKSVAMNYSRAAAIVVPFGILYTYSLIALILMSIGQWLSLRREFANASLWIAGNLVAWIAAVVSELILFNFLSANILIYFVIILTMSLIYNLITGSTLSIIINSPKNALETI